jgi:hypothetical protein
VPLRPMAPRELVWKLHTDISAWPTWQTDIKEAVLEGKLEPGNSFRWTTFGMTITSTVYALEAGSRILWGGNAGDIVGIHEWTFIETPSGVDVTTNESFGGGTVAKDAAKMQTLLDQSLVDWLQRLRLDESPEMVEALTAARLSSRDYVLTVVAAIPATIALHKGDRVVATQLPEGLSRGNFDFARSHPELIKELVDETKAMLERVRGAAVPTQR